MLNYRRIKVFKKSPNLMRKTNSFTDNLSRDEKVREFHWSHEYISRLGIYLYPLETTSSFVRICCFSFRLAFIFSHIISASDFPV